MKNENDLKQNEEQAAVLPLDNAEEGTPVAAPYDFTYRVWFSKKGQAKYISHLDLLRTMTRVVRRAELPIWYTEGFNRHPYLTFAVALSLGFEAERESMDLRFIGDISCDEVKKRMNENLPAGLEIVSVAPPEMDAREIDRSDYILTLFEVPDRFGEFSSTESIVAKKLTKKKKVKEIELKSFIEKADSSYNQDKNSLSINISLPTGSSENINPTLIIDAYYDFLGVEESERFFSVNRKGMFSGERHFA